MIFRLFRPSPRDHSIASLYGMIVAQARAPAFYQFYGVPDTVNGRLEMIILHAVLLLRRLNIDRTSTSALGQAIFDRFCSDMDANLREMGVGDLTVPRTMQQIGEAFYGRQAAYEAALAVDNRDVLAATLARNVFGTGAELGGGAIRLAAYVRETVRRLADQDTAALSSGVLKYPEPAAVAAAQTPTGDSKA
jgi:cytochrome b pre-mRNA-processing protein 3